MKEARIMKENITYYLVWIICLLAGCTPTPKQIEDTTDPIPMYPDYTDIMIPTNIAPLNFLLRKSLGKRRVLAWTAQTKNVFGDVPLTQYALTGTPLAGSGQPPANNRSRPYQG